MSDDPEIGATPPAVAFVPQACREAKAGESIIMTEGHAQALTCLQAGQLAIGLSHIWSASAKLPDTGKLVLHQAWSQGLYRVRVGTRPGYAASDDQAFSATQCRRG